MPDNALNIVNGKKLRLVQGKISLRIDVADEDALPSEAEMALQRKLESQIEANNEQGKVMDALGRGRALRRRRAHSRTLTLTRTHHAR